MKTKNLLLLILFTSFLGMYGCCSASVVKKSRQVSSFKKISASYGIDVYFTQKSVQSVEVEAEEDIISEIVTQVEGETLVIKKDRQGKVFSFNKNDHKSVKVYVAAPVLEELSLSGGSDFYADNLNCEGSFSLNASGGADTHINRMNVSKSISIAVSGGSDCSIKSLQSADCSFSASGGGDLDIVLNASGNVAAAASGGSDIKLSGNAVDVVVSASGGSDIDVRKLNYKNISTHKSGGSDIFQ